MKNINEYLINDYKFIYPFKYFFWDKRITQDLFNIIYPNNMICKLSWSLCKIYRIIWTRDCIAKTRHNNGAIGMVGGI